MSNELTNHSQFLFYTSENGNTNVQVIVEDETVWATQATISEVFNTSRTSIVEHIKNIYQSHELNENSTCRKIRHVANDGKNREFKYYNLDMIISVGYRVNSYQATQFRIWANSVLKEYLIKGFTLDDERLKQGNQLFGKDYFDELLERIREIRASERRFYQKITDLFSESTIDYDKNSPTAQSFYATVQNKLHYAIHSNTAAEIVKNRADATKINMGLTSWKNDKRGGKILKSDTLIAKNYLNENELKDLNLLVEQCLGYVEGLTRKHIALTMSEWVNRLDKFLQFNEYPVLDNLGAVSAEQAKQIAEDEYNKFRPIQDRAYQSDFDKIIENVKLVKVSQSTE